MQIYHQLDNHVGESSPQPESDPSRNPWTQTFHGDRQANSLRLQQQDVNMDETKRRLDEGRMLDFRSQDDVAYERSESIWKQGGRFHTWYLWSTRIREVAQFGFRSKPFAYTSLSDLQPDYPHRSSITPSIDQKTGPSRVRRIFGCAVVGLLLVIAVCALHGTRTLRGGWTMTGATGDSTCIRECNDQSVATDIASPLYHLFNISSLPEPVMDPDIRPIQLRTPRHLPLAHACLDAWFNSGTLCDRDIGPQDLLDLVYLWVNGSDPIWHDQYELTRDLEFPDQRPTGTRYNPDPPARHYRSQGAFKYALRSGVEAFKRKGKAAPSWIRKLHVLTADMPVPTEDGSDLALADYRLGQIPDWLDKERVFRVAVDVGEAEYRPVATRRNDAPLEHPSLQWHFHSEVFRAPILPLGCGTNCTAIQAERDWSSEVTPTFNSFAIENRMAWLDDLADCSVQVNDDMYFGRSLSSADFHSTLYGSVFHLDHQFGLQVKPILIPSKVSDNGEWGGLQHASWLISQRFPSRVRNYLDHLPKSICAPMLQEASIMFASSLNHAAQRHFRESPRGVGDISMAFLTTHMKIERWREALLWTWVVAKVGFSGVWGDEARREVAHLLGLAETETEPGNRVKIQRAERDTLDDVVSNFAKAGWEPAQATSFRFSSMDGHLPRIPDDRTHDNVNECEIDVDDCFGTVFLQGQDVDAGGMFKRLAFEKYQCGDCLIMALVNQSGRKGLSAFLPRDDQVLSVEGDSSQPPHLPLTPTWSETDFSLAHVVEAAPGTLANAGKVNVRTWTMLLLSRYLYMSGESPAHFASLKQASQAANTFTYLRQNPGLGMICLNDDEADGAAEQIGGFLHDWLEERWGGAGVWWER